MVSATHLRVLHGLCCSFVSEVDGAFPEREKAAQHLLLFVSALIPKAISSLLTSAIIELSKSENVNLYRLLPPPRV